MDIVDWILIILSLIDLIIIGGFSIIRTYYQRRAVQLQETILKESREYWNSWKERSQNIATEVKDEIEKREVDEEAEKHKRPSTRSRRTRY
jgi:gas vesicle protein